MRKYIIVLILVLSLILSGCTIFTKGASDDYFDMVKAINNIDEMDQGEYPNYAGYRTKDSLDYNKLTDLNLDMSYFLVSLFYDLSGVGQHMGVYPNDCNVKSEQVQDCNLFADEANIYYTYTDDSTFQFQEYYYSTKPSYDTLLGGDFEAVSRQLLLDNQETTYYSLRGNGTFGFQKYHENNFFLELRGNNDVIYEYVWYDIKLDEFIRVLRTDSGKYDITYYKDSLYVHASYIDGEIPEWTYYNLSTFNEDGNKKVSYLFSRGTSTSTMYNLKYLDGWKYIGYEGARNFYITNEEEIRIDSIYDANQIQITHSVQTLEDIGLVLSIDVMSAGELKVKATSEFLNMLEYFEIAFVEGELSNTYLDLIDIEMIEGLNVKD